MAGPLPKALATAALSTVVFSASFAALFMRSESVFVQILAQHKPQSEEDMLTREEKDQFVYWSFRTSEINKMIDDLASEKEALKARELALASQQAQLESERKENERLRDEIVRARKELSQYLIEVKAGEAARLQEEVKIINNMTPANVVTLFNEKSDDEVVKVLSMMKADTIGPILDLMMAQPQTDQMNGTPQQRVATLLEKLKRLRNVDQ